jgi:hypothetical protein
MEQDFNLKFTRLRRPYYNTMDQSVVLNPPVPIKKIDASVDPSVRVPVSC